LFFHVDKRSSEPAYIQIEESIRKLIAQGALRAGARLPGRRELARDLGVNRNTINKALQRLETEGLISSEVGKGTFVSVTPVALPAPAAQREADDESLLRIWGPLFTHPRPAPRALPSITPRKKGIRTVSFVYAAPPPDLFPANDFRRCIDYVIKRRVNEICRIGPPDGLPSLKEHLVQWLAQHGIFASERNIVVTTGCQQSLDLIRKTLVHPGDSLLLENPTFPGAVGALSPSGIGLLEMPVQEDGPDARILNSLGTRNRCKLIYVSPTFQNPTGWTMAAEARIQLIETALHSGIPIIEDDVFGQLRYDGPVQPSLYSICPNLVIYIGSFSKMLSPGLRLGWIVAPIPVAGQLAVTKQASDLHTGMLIQTAMDEFCRRGLMLRHLKRMRRVFRNRRDAMVEALQRWFPSDARWQVPQGGLSMWVTLPGDWDTEELLAAAQEGGVQFVPGSAFYFRSALTNSMRLSFATENEQAITYGIKTLGEIISRQRSRPPQVNHWMPEASRAIV
jgi:2-aminoadipate transaminase